MKDSQDPNNIVKVWHIFANQLCSSSTIHLFIVHQLIMQLVSNDVGVVYGWELIFFANEKSYWNIFTCLDIDLSSFKVAAEITVGIILKSILLEVLCVVNQRAQWTTLRVMTHVYK